MKIYKIIVCRILQALLIIVNGTVDDTKGWNVEMQNGAKTS